MSEMYGIEQRGNGKFRVRIWHNGQRYSAGTFDDIPAALKARQSLEDTLAAAEAVPTTPGFHGVTVSEQIDENAVYQKAVDQYSRTALMAKRQEKQYLVFEGDTVAIAWAADQHFGDPGTDVERAFDEASIALSMPNTYIGTVGDIINNFVLMKMRHIRDSSSFSIPEEWILARMYMKLIAPAWRIAVAGNHDLWTELLAGVDFVREDVRNYAPEVLYDAYQTDITVVMGDVQFPGRIRHEWLRKSMYNASHGMEQAARFDQNFLWAIGAHEHNSGLVREFNVGGATHVAAMCGAYKRHDKFARMVGFPRSNGSTMVVTVFDKPTRSIIGFSNLEAAARFMQTTV